MRGRSPFGVGIALQLFLGFEFGKSTGIPPFAPTSNAPAVAEFAIERGASAP